MAAWLALESVAGVESSKRDGAPARSPHAAALAASASRCESGPLLFVLPADHVIADAHAGLGTIQHDAEGHEIPCAAAAKRGARGRGERGDGYLLKGGAGDETASWYRLERFVEKPNRPTVKDYVKLGSCLWNSRMVVLSVRRYLEELARPCAGNRRGVGPRSARQRESRFPPAWRLFLESPSDSIDFMEKTDAAVVVRLDAGLNNVGSCAALHEIVEKDANGNVLHGDAIAEGCRNCYIAS